MCFFVLLVPLLVFFYPAIVIFLVYSLYQKILSKNKIYVYVFRFFFGYIGISVFAICIYLLFSYINDISNSTSTRTDIIYIFTAVAGISAPISVLLGLNEWKKQHFITLKIQAIDNLKKTLIEQLDLLNDFWLEDNTALLTGGVNNFDYKIKFNQRYEMLVDRFESLRNKLKNILECEGFYFGIDSQDLKDLYKYHDDTYEVIVELDKAKDNLKNFLWNDFKVVGSNKNQYYQSLYFISPNGFLFQKLKEQRGINSEELKKQKQLKIVSKIQVFYNFLNNKLNEIYVN